MKNKKIAIIGMGEIGRAIRDVLSVKNIQLKIWNRGANAAASQRLLADVVSGADIVFLCVPSWAVREIALGIAGYLKKDAIIVCLAKGIEIKTKKTMDEVLKRVLPKTQFALLGGPMIAEELVMGKKGIGVVGTADKKVFLKVKNLFKNTNLSIEYCADVHGVALCGVLKNIYAVGLGAIDALGLGGNFKSQFASSAVNEMAKILNFLGANPKTAYSDAGMGDLMATGYSVYSRNRQVGEDLVKTGKCRLNGEGYVSFQPLVSLIGRRLEKLPLLKVLKAVILERKNANKVFKNLF